jgi:hypothetical protein
LLHEVGSVVVQSFELFFAEVVLLLELGAKLSNLFLNLFGDRRGLGACSRSSSICGLM